MKPYEGLKVVTPPLQQIQSCESLFKKISLHSLRDLTPYTANTRSLYNVYT
jgi:hypothetical protein